ncbi:hypothetical protein KP509_12G027900 [Ceratopteris richardii]|uniref:Senescence domain-containing protein n=1 Tax=Ceratopteris richardii TaxID=49495 RepID=A0A8T2TN53_CERRI|nr:hypothetical protein KP509_12G027900 [Ceratopteris richardii]
MPWFSSSSKKEGSSNSGKKQKGEEVPDKQAENVVKVDNYLVVGDAQSSQQGTVETLLNVPSAIVHLVDDEESALLATGVFSLFRLVSQNGSVIAVFAKVGDYLQWPLAKDAATVKLDSNHYFFTLHVPAEGENDGCSHEQDDSDVFNYGITFTSDVDQSLLAELDKYLEQYSCFSVPQVVQGAPERKAEFEKEVKEKGKGPFSSLQDILFGKPNPPAKPTSIPEDAKVNAVPSSIASPVEREKFIEEKSSAYWTALAPNVDEYSSTIAKGIAAQSGNVIRGLFWCSDATVQQLERLGEHAKNHIKQKEKPTQISPRTLRNLRRVKKLSKMSERVAKGVLAGVITVTGFASATVMKSKAGKKFIGMLPGEVALVSLDVFGRVFDAVELAGKSVLKGTKAVTCDVVAHRYGEQAAEAANESLSTAGHVFGTVWTISKIRKALDPKRKSTSNVPKRAIVKAALTGKAPAQ